MSRLSTTKFPQTRDIFETFFEPDHAKFRYGELMRRFNITLLIEYSSDPSEGIDSVKIIMMNEENCISKMISFASLEAMEDDYIFDVIDAYYTEMIHDLANEVLN